MKTLGKLAIIAGLALAVSTQAVTLTQVNGIVSGNVTGPQDVIDDFGIDPCDVLYKTDDNSGLMSDHFSDDDGENPLTISYDGTVPRPTLTYLAIKAGNFYTLYQITDWSGEDIVVVQDQIMNPPRNAFLDISHVVLFGKDDGGGGGGGDVPDAGSTALLMGLGTLALAGASRKIKK